MAKDKRSRDQKRKAKLSERPRKHKSSTVEPYEGTKYQREEWVPLVYATEKAIYEVIRLTERKLTNDEVKKGLEELVLDLRRGLPPTLTPADPEPALQVGQASAYVAWNIRRHWSAFFVLEGVVAVADLVGVLRTLLYSIEAHQWETGRQRGYVAFLQQFIEEGGLDKDLSLMPDLPEEDDLDEEDDLEDDEPDAPDKSRLWR